MGVHLTNGCASHIGVHLIHECAPHIWACVIYRVVDARNYVAPGADRPPAAARALAEYIVRLLPP